MILIQPRRESGCLNELKHVNELKHINEIKQVLDTVSATKQVLIKWEFWLLLLDTSGC